MLPWIIGIAAALLFVVFAPLRKRGRHGLVEEVDPVLRMRWRDRRPSTQIAGRKWCDHDAPFCVITIVRHTHDTPQAMRRSTTSERLRGPPRRADSPA